MSTIALDSIFNLLAVRRRWRKTAAAMAIADPVAATRSLLAIGWRPSDWTLDDPDLADIANVAVNVVGAVGDGIGRGIRYTDLPSHAADLAHSRLIRSPIADVGAADLAAWAARRVNALRVHRRIVQAVLRERRLTDRLTLAQRLSDEALRLQHQAARLIEGRAA